VSGDERSVDPRLIYGGRFDKNELFHLAPFKDHSIQESYCAIFQNNIEAQ